MGSPELYWSVFTLVYLGYMSSTSLQYTVLFDVRNGPGMTRKLSSVYRLHPHHVLNLAMGGAWKERTLAAGIDKRKGIFF